MSAERQALVPQIGDAIIYHSVWDNTNRWCGLVLKRNVVGATERMHFVDVLKFGAKLEGDMVWLDQIEKIVGAA